MTCVMSVLSSLNAVALSELAKSKMLSNCLTSDRHGSRQIGKYGLGFGNSDGRNPDNVAKFLKRIISYSLAISA